MNEKPKNNNDIEQEVIDLNQNIKGLNENIRKQISFKRIFFLSIISGIGYTIGAGIAAGILIAVLVKTTQHFPILEKFQLNRFEQQQQK